ncbi:MAG: propionyl-CoA synthetase, partial [Alphaproteobacteria bacterium]|nr:propionyl-CoA synthetase [Alphaproteobacteria bacterium]
MTSGTYAPIHAASLADRDGFWAARAADIAWTRRWDKVCDDSRPPFYRWFPGGELNTCFNAVDRHVEAGHGDRLAIVHDSPVTGGTIERITYRDLRDRVARFAGVLAGI